MPKATEPMGCRKQIFGRLKFIGTYSLQPSSTERECEGQPGGVGVCARVRSAAMFVQGALESMSARCTARCLALTFVDPRKCHSLLFRGHIKNGSPSSDEFPVHKNRHNKVFPLPGGNQAVVFSLPSTFEVMTGFIDCCLTHS